MKSIPLFLVLLIVLMGNNTLAQAKNLEETMQALRQPLLLANGTAPRMHVTFLHTDHKGITCMHCHHNMSSEGRYVPCTTCHCTPGVRERAPISMFMAFHAGDSAHSCISCHRQLVAKAPEKYALPFRGCRPCHMSPASRKALNVSRITE